MITKSLINPKNQNCKIVGCSNLLIKKRKIVRTTVGSIHSTFYSWNADDINQILKQEINETFPTYYDELKNLDDTWKPISLQGENSKALLFLPFLPKWEIQNDKRVFTGIWDTRNKQEYDLNEKFVQKIWSQIQLLDQRIIGTILANGHVTRQSPYIQFSLKNAQNVYWKYIFLKPFSNLAPLLQQHTKVRVGKIYYGYKFFTRSVFQDYRQLFYPDGIKIVPSCIPDLLQTPEGLAEFFMDISSFNKTYGFITLYIESFSRDEQEFIQELLLKFHGLESSIHKKSSNHSMLYLPKKNNSILISKLKDHLLPMFYYKLGLENKLQSHEMEDSFNQQDLREFQRNLNSGVLL